MERGQKGPAAARQRVGFIRVHHAPFNEQPNSQE